MSVHGTELMNMLLAGDIVTTPTQAMLQAAINATFKDDVYREDTATEDFQAEMARLTEHEDALFLLSGTMGNQLALRALLAQPPHSILCARRGHIVQYEAGGVASMTGAMLQTVEPKNRKYLTVEDVKEHAVLDDYIQFAPTKVIALENTLNGVVTPLEEIRKMSAFARENGVKMHLDGARIFEAVATGAGTLPEFTREFDTVVMCFEKGLGAPLGSILVGSKKTIAQARKVRQSIGGGFHQAGMLTAMARVALKQTFGDGVDGKDSLIARSHQNALRITDLWTRSGGKLLGSTETCMVWLDLKAARLQRKELERMASEYGLLIKNERLVVHYRESFLVDSHTSEADTLAEISEEAIRRIEALFAAIAARKPSELRLQEANL